MADRLEVRLHSEQVGWITRASRRERIEFEWIDGYTPGPVALTESFGSVLLKAPSPAASSFFGGYALEGRQRERLTQRRGISDPADLYAMLREFGSSIAGAVTVTDPDTASRTQPAYEPISDGEIIRRLRRAANDGDLGSDDQSRSMLAGLQPKLLLARFDDCCSPGSTVAGTFPTAVRTPPTSSSRDSPGARMGWPGSTTAMRWPPSSGSRTTVRSSSATAPASTWSSSATTGLLMARRSP